MHARAAITVRGSREHVERRWREVGGVEGVNVTTRFVDAPGDRGTELHLSFDAPGGMAGGAVKAIKKISGDDREQVVRDQLRRFKQLAEAGEIARSDGVPQGHSAADQPKQRPAQPLEPATIGGGRR